MPRGKKIQSNAQMPVDQNNQLVEIIQSLSKSVQLVADELKTVKSELAEIKSSTNPTENVLSITKQVEQANQDFTKSVPKDFLTTARGILNDKFVFECEPCVDRPMFTFTVIVPKEYSSLPEGQEDRRPKVIENVLGVNGVRDWCLLVKQNIVKTMGKQIKV